MAALARLSPKTRGELSVELLLEAGALVAGIAIGVGAARLVLSGLLALTFRRGRP